MGKSNAVHVGAGGVVAGIVINVIAKGTWSFFLPSGTLGGSYLWGLVVGMVTVSLYSSLSARSGPSPARAALAGVTVWVFTIVLPNYGLFVFEILSRSLLTFSSVLGMAEVVPAALVGALTYDWVAAKQLPRAQQQQPRKQLRVRLASLTPPNAEPV